MSLGRPWYSKGVDPECEWDPYDGGDAYPECLCKEVGNECSEKSERHRATARWSRWRRRHARRQTRRA